MMLRAEPEAEHQQKLRGCQASGFCISPLLGKANSMERQISMKLRLWAQPNDSLEYTEKVFGNQEI